MGRQHHEAAGGEGNPCPLLYKKGDDPPPARAEVAVSRKPLRAEEVDVPSDDAGTVWLRSRTIKPRTRRRQHAGEDKRSPLPQQHSQPEIVVVVLGVMYPSVLPQPVDALNRPDLPLLSFELDTARQSTDVIFHDPFSPLQNGDEASLASNYGKKHKGTGYENHAEAQKAVARDLTLLLTETRATPTRSQQPSHSGTTHGDIIQGADWKDLRPGHEVEVLDDGLVIARGLIEHLSWDQGTIRLKLSYGRGRRTYRRRDGWQVRTVCQNGPTQSGKSTTF